MSDPIEDKVLPILSMLEIGAFHYWRSPEMGVGIIVGPLPDDEPLSQSLVEDITAAFNYELLLRKNNLTDKR